MRQFSRFVTVGAFNTLLGYCVIFACMYLVGVSAEASNIMGYAVGLVSSYVLNKNYTFKSKQDHREEMFRFLVVFIGAYIANFTFLLVLIRWVGMHAGVSQILAGLIYVAVSYVMNKNFVFRNSNEK